MLLRRHRLFSEEIKFPAKLCVIGLHVESGFPGLIGNALNSIRAGPKGKTHMERVVSELLKWKTRRDSNSECRRFILTDFYWNLLHVIPIYKYKQRNEKKESRVRTNNILMSNYRSLHKLNMQNCMSTAGSDCSLLFHGLWTQTDASHAIRETCDDRCGAFSIKRIPDKRASDKNISAVSLPPHLHSRESDFYLPNE